MHGRIYSECVLNILECIQNIFRLCQCTHSAFKTYSEPTQHVLWYTVSFLQQIQRVFRVYARILKASAHDNKLHSEHPRANYSSDLK